MKPEESCRVKVICRDSRFLTLHISHKSQDSLSSVSLAKDFYFIVGFAPCASNFESESNLKSAATIIYFFIYIELF